MNVKISPAPLKGTVAAIASKSDAHRLLLCAALANRETEITLSSTSRDIEATASCLAALGAKFERTGKGLLVTPVKNAVQNPVLNCGESGSTLRFLLPTAAAVSEAPELRGEGRLPQRPVGDLLDALERRGKTIVSREFPLRLSGTLTSGIFEVPGSVSSQFVSGLLMAAPLTGGDCDIRLTSPLSSGKYVSMTVSAMRKFGAMVTETDAGYHVAARPYCSPRRIDAEGDWSNAAFWLTAAALGGEVTVTGLPADSLQPDRRLLAILQDYGADIETNGNAVTCKAALRCPFDLDTDSSPDLAPVLCVLAAGANGSSRIRGIARLREKESDRVASCAALVRNLGGELEVWDDSFLIQGKPQLSGGTVNAMGDHRIVMAAAAASVLCGGDVTVLGAQAADKSYPGFFTDFKMLGGRTTEC